MQTIAECIAGELNLKVGQIQAAIDLLDEGSTVPFIARYRKETTGGMSDIDLRELNERLIYLRELNTRREAIIKSIAEQEKLTPELTKQLQKAVTKSELEDIYRPYKPKRRTKGQIAIEAGLKSLAMALLDNPELDPKKEAEKYLNPEKAIKEVNDALLGAKYILMEQFADDGQLYAKLREHIWEHGLVSTQSLPDKEKDGQKFRDYFSYCEAINKIPSHRLLAILRGRNEQVLKVDIELPEGQAITELMIKQHFSLQDKNRPADAWLNEVVKWTWKIKLQPQIELELVAKARESAEEQAINVFADNLKNLLMAAPAGKVVTMGLDPGIRTGVKLAIVDDTGKLLTTSTLYPHPPQKKWDASMAEIATLCKQYQVNLICIGNGTASRETDQLVTETLSKIKPHNIYKLVVSEAGASVYSASPIASEEFPDLDVSLRGAVSIARRVQDPLAELVKIEPKAIGVGQYQHDVNQVKLKRKLDAVVEDCVNAVGVDLNTASASLLSRVSGLNKTLAENVVVFRDQNGRFSNREQLHKVTRLGEKAFEQAAGFLRISEGDEPLDQSGVHPESYYVVKAMANACNVEPTEMIGNKKVLQNVNLEKFVDDKLGLPTLQDIIKELDKPGRDPRGDFQMVEFKEGVTTLQDLKEGMLLNGVVTNVTKFGAFVDIGVHQDGLVHISEMADRFVSDPSEIVKTGEHVKVKVTGVDLDRKRIALSMKTGASKGQRAPVKKAAQPQQSAFAAALSKALN